MRTLLPALISSAALGVACDAPTEPVQPQAFVSATALTYPTAPQAFAVSASAGSIYVDGAIATPVFCYGFDADARRSGRELVITLRTAPNSSGCLALGGWWDYRISVRQVPAGTWTVVVRHADPAIDTAFTGSVDVPLSD